MPDVDDILTMNSTESRCSINGDTRDIVVPDEYHIFGVESDENVTRIPFICPKIVGDNVDLTGYSLYINYINGAGLGGIYVVDDVVTSGDNITFSWLLSRNVTAKAGKVSYIICAKKSGTDTKVTNEWNTKIATGTVSSGIETHDTVVQQSSDVINKLLKLTQGESAYDIAIDNGFVGTKAEWLESLKGADGAPGKDGADGKPGENGADGYSPTANVTQNDNGATITIADKNGTTTATITNGKNGDDGKPGAAGADGITPTIGENGNWYLGDTDTGKPSRGADGKTPVIGTDYWTASDKAEVVAEAAAAVDLTPYAKKTEVPTKTSQITNDSGFLTSHQDISGKQDKATLEADVAAKGFTKNTGTYSKPTGGIPKADLAEAVQTSLSKADSALQAEDINSYATEQYVDNHHDGTKQDVISDLSTIRSGASKGATAYQKPTGGIPKTDLAASVQTSLGKADMVDTLVPDAATAQNQLADKLFVYAQAGQVTPLFANSTADCTDTTKVYVLPDGYIYGYINGAWTNTGHQFTNAEALEKVIDATCDIETISGGNYNLLKVSEVSFSSRLQDNVSGIIASTVTNIVTGWIPVRQGKYYAVSALVDGIKDAEAGLDRNFVQRINAKKADGTILVYNRYPTELRTEIRRGKAYSVPEDVTEMMFHIQIQDRTPQSLDISTSTKLKAFEPMIVEGDTAALAISNSINFAYVDGDEDAPSVVNYALKHDPYVTSALFSEQTDVAITKIGAEIGRSLTTAGPTNLNPASVTTAFLVNKPGAKITVSSNAYRFQVSEFSAKSDSALARYSGVIDYGTTFTTGASPYVRIAIRNVNGDTADLNILDNIIISASEQSNFVSTNRRMDDFEYRLRSVEDADASLFKRDVDYGIIPTSYYKGVGTNYTTTFNADTQYASFMSAWDTLISGHSGYVTKTDLGLCSDETQSLYLYDFKPVRASEQLTPTPKVIITAGQHGNEKANVFGLYYFVDNLLNNWFKHPALEYLRTDVELLIVPVVNPSGFNNKTYKNSNGVNINRNYDAGWVLVDDSTSDQYGGAAPFDQPESIIIRDLILDNLDALLAIDFHVCSSASAASIDVMTYYGICPTNDKYYKRMIDVAAHQLTAISTNFNHDYSLGAPDMLSGYMLIYSGAGILRQWVTDQNVIGVLLEGLTGLPNQTVYAADAFKANEELLVNYILTALKYLKG